MSQDETIELAKQAGLMADGEMWFSPTYGSGDVHISHLQTFAKLVAQRTWVGLIPEEIDEIIEDSIDKMDALIQTMDKLKDKNT